MLSSDPKGQAVPKPAGLGQEGLEGPAAVQWSRAQGQERLEARVAIPLQGHDTCGFNGRRASPRCLCPGRRRRAQSVAGGQQGGVDAARRAATTRGPHRIRRPRIRAPPRVFSMWSRDDARVEGSDPEPRRPARATRNSAAAAPPQRGVAARSSRRAGGALAGRAPPPPDLVSHKSQSAP